MTDESSELDNLIAEKGQSSEFDWGADELDESAVVEVDVLRFTAGETPFAALGSLVKEVIGGDIEITRLPGAPDYIKGIAVLKRQIVGVIDLRAWLGLPPRRGRKVSERMLVLESDGLIAACAVDDVLGIETWPDVEVGANLPATLDDRTRRYSRSAQWAPGGIVVLLDFEKILEEAAVR